MSQSARMQERFTRRLLLRRTAAILYIISGIVYLTWRFTIINEKALFLSGIYYASDVIAILLGALTIFVSWSYRHRRSPLAPDGLSVDVFIPTYREPVEMVKRTLEGALAIHYPHETWLLDDGNRPAMRALAAELGCHYVARTENSGAKAGNLNHALAESKADFIAVFDADHIPQTHALDATLGFFSDPKVGMVQTPQDYYNVDALQYMNSSRGGLWHDQSFFYNLSQPGRDHYSAASCAGTSVVYRRAALDAIGGIPADTVTEDFHTSLKLQKAGYNVPYLNEPIAYGIAAADLADYYRTRLRYGHGNIHVLRAERIFWTRGLTLRQRLSYLSLGLIYLEGWQQLMVFMVPAIALIFGIAPFEITILNVLIVLAYPLWSYLLMQEIGCGFSRYWTAEIYSMMRFPVHLLAAAALFKDRLVWRSSRKNVEGQLHLRLLIPQAVVLVVSLVAVAVGFYRLEGRYTPGPLVAAVVDRLPDPAIVVDSYHAVAEFVGETGEKIVALVSPKAEQPAQEAAPAAPAAPGEAAAPVPAQPAAPPPVVVVEAPKPAPAPIDWFEPLTRGYTIDLVLIAGFWAVFNALRVICVFGKVVNNARRTHDDYLFQTVAPIRVDTAEGPRYVIAERLSASKAVISGALGGLSEADLVQGIKATAYLPSGTAHIVLTPEDDSWVPGRKVRGERFTIDYPQPADRRTMEDGLYMTSWQRECNQSDAEFRTPLNTLAAFVGLSRRKPQPWQPALVHVDDHSEPELALYRKSGELLLLSGREPDRDVVKAVTIGRSGWRVQRLLLRQLVSTEPLHSATPHPRRMFRYNTEPYAAADNVAVLRDRKRQPHLVVVPQAAKDHATAV